MKNIDFQLWYSLALEPPSKVMGGHPWRIFLYLQYLAGKLIFYAPCCSANQYAPCYNEFCMGLPSQNFNSYSYEKNLMGSADPKWGQVHLKMLSRSSGEQYFKSYGSTVLLSCTPHPAVLPTGSGLRHYVLYVYRLSMHTYCTVEDVVTCTCISET